MLQLVPTYFLTCVEDCKRFYGYSCVKFPDCPSGPEFVRNKIATLCGFENGTAKICCPRASAPITPATVRPPIKVTPVTAGPTPITPSRRPTSGPITVRPPTTATRQPVRPTPKNATATAILSKTRLQLPNRGAWLRLCL